MIATQGHSHAEGSGNELNIGRLAPAAGLVGGLGVLASVALMFTEWGQQMLGSYLFAFIVFMSVTLGFFGLTLLHHTVRGSWGLPILRLLEAGSSWKTFALMLAMFIPVLLNVNFSHHGIYEWTHTEVVEADNLLKWKQPYLNPLRFTTTTVVFFFFWMALSAGLRASSRRQDQSRDFKEEQRRTNWASPGLVAFILTATFAFVDWGMTLEPHWYSTMYGVWCIVGAGLAGLALATLILCTNAHREPFRGVVTPNLTRDLGNLLFVFTMLWAYTSVSQFLIIWNGNIPEQTQYYVRRSEVGWNAVGMALIIGQFLVPFMALLAPRMKRTPGRLAIVAGWILVMRLVDHFYILGPAIPGRPFQGPVPTLFDALALLTVGAIWFFAFASQVRGAPLLPEYDPRLRETDPHAH